MARFMSNELDITMDYSRVLLSVVCRLGDRANRERVLKTDPILRKIDENSD